MTCIILFFLLLFSLIFPFIKNYFHFLNILLVFEWSIMLIFMGFNLYQDLFIILVFCVFAVCKSSLGLSILVTMIRCTGSDFCALKFLTC